MIFLQEEDTNFGFRFENCYLKRSSRVFQRSGHDPAFGRNLELEKKTSELILTFYLSLYFLFRNKFALLLPFLKVLPFPHSLHFCLPFLRMLLISAMISSRSLVPSRLRLRLLQQLLLLQSALLTSKTVRASATLGSTSLTSTLTSPISTS